MEEKLIIGAIALLGCILLIAYMTSYASVYQHFANYQKYSEHNQKEDMLDVRRIFRLNLPPSQHSHAEQARKRFNRSRAMTIIWLLILWLIPIWVIVANEMQWEILG